MYRIFPFTPAWPPTGEAYREQFDFVTDIFTSRDGTEYRSAQRDSPRRQVSFTTMLLDQASRVSFSRFMRDLRRDEPDWFPDWLRYREVIGGSPEGSSIISTSPQGVDEQPGGIDWSRPGMSAVVLTPEGKAHRSEITSRSNSTIVLMDPLPFDVPVGSRIYAANPGRLQDGIQVTQRTSNYWVARVIYDIDPSYPSLIDGYDVDNDLGWYTRVNWASPVEVTYSKTLDILDFGFGRVSVEDHTRHSGRVISAAYLNVNREQSNDALTKFLKARGRLLEFEHIMPSERAWEIPADETIEYGKDTLRVIGEDAYLDFKEPSDEFNTRVKIISDTDWSPLGEVTNVTYDALANESILSVSWLGPDPGSPLSPSRILNIGWSNKGRFGSDSFSLEYLTDKVSQYNITLSILPRE